MKYWTVTNEEGSILEFFAIEQECKDFITAKIKEAEDNVDIDGYPSFVNDLCYHECRGYVSDHSGGLKLYTRNSDSPNK